MYCIDYPPPSPFLCPSIRIGGHRFQEKEIGEGIYHIIDNSYHISDATEEELSYSHQLFLLYGCNNKEGESNGLYCWVCYTDKIGTIYYFCNQCESPYHKECVESPPIFISPYHPKYPLQLLKPVNDCRKEPCHSCGVLFSYTFFYYSSICGLILDPVCARKQEFSTINNPKRHEHVLYYFPRKAFITCDVCGLDDNKLCFYVCLQCSFVVHITCINLPRVILISFHNHRLSFTSSLPFGNWLCGICRRKIDENYGAYSCTKDCAYAVHSKCATNPNVWDGKELKDQPEMVYDNLKPFEEIGDGTIQHFSHAQHPIRLHEGTKRVYDEEQHCQACILPFYDGNVYRCMQCDFALHEACANLPRIKQITVHHHRFILKPISDTKSSFCCYSCYRESCGFRYVCSEGCGEFYNLDVRCASLSELVDHSSHPHPLFLNYERGFFQTCSTCTKRSACKSLNCVECDFSLCFRCVTLPSTVKHKDDEHMLNLSYEKSASGHLYWCQVCEKTMDPKKGYYGCNDCGVTFHIECTLRTNNPNVKAGYTIETKGKKIEVILNNRLSRLLCNECHRRCPYKIAYKTPAGNIICSMEEIDWDTM